MTADDARGYPRRVALEDGEVELGLMTRADEAAVLAWARSLPAHDLLFLPRDISEPRVLAAWVNEIERGGMLSVLARRGERVLGCAALLRDELSWSPHVGELRILVLPEMRGKGLGRLLTRECFAIALALGLEKLVAHMTADQRGAIAVFEDLGFRGEALLRDQVKDRTGAKHDIVVLGHDVARFQAQREAYGVAGAL